MHFGAPRDASNPLESLKYVKSRMNHFCAAPQACFGLLGVAREEWLYCARRGCRGQPSNKSRFSPFRIFRWHGAWAGEVGNQLKVADLGQLAKERFRAPTALSKAAGSMSAFHS
jgi:hypothetical protein